MRILVPAICSAVGTTVGVVTYVTIAEAGNATATVAGTGTTLLSLLMGKGAEWVAGPGTGQVVQVMTHEAGQSYLVPMIRRSTRLTAAGVAALTGGAATLLSAALWHSGQFIVDYLKSSQAAPVPIKFEVKEEGESGISDEFVLLDVQSSPRKAAVAVGWVYSAHDSALPQQEQQQEQSQEQPQAQQQEQPQEQPQEQQQQETPLLP
jgi:hypothetical protein